MVFVLDLNFQFFPSNKILYLQNDQRKYIALSTFGFYKEGILDVKLSNFKGNPPLKETDIVSTNGFIDNMNIKYTYLLVNFLWKEELFILSYCPHNLGPGPLYTSMT